MDAATWDERYRTAGFVWTTEPNMFLGPEVDGLTPGRALDLACGEGRNAVWLATQGWDATGVDFSAAGLAKAGELAASAGVADRCRWVCADATTYEPDDAYDLVAVFYLQLPADARRAAMTVAARAMAPGATMVVVAHDTDNLTAGVGGPPDPAVLYSPDDVVADLAASGVDGLTVERATQVLRPVTVTGEDGEPVQRNAIDCLVRVRRG